MADLMARRVFLRVSQNPDGGWGYFAGKQSWLEPTVFAALALLRAAGGSEDAARRAWALLRSWQNQDGGWRPNATVPDSTWSTALAVTFGGALGDTGQVVDRGVAWLVSGCGAESSAWSRALRFLGIGPWEREVKHKGWPWRPGTSAWVEPTTHALVALRGAAAKQSDARLRARIESGERMLLATRCADGGWNYGSPRALGVGLPSYPETTALALVGLQGRAPHDAFEKALHFARSESVSPLARAWLNIALRLGGREPEGAPNRASPSDDVLVAALECLAAVDGNWSLLRAANSA